MSDLEVRLTPTVSDFVESRADIPILLGPRREGKSIGGVAAIIRHANRHRHAWPIHWAVVRDTWVNLERTVIETLREGHLNGWWTAEFSAANTKAVLNQGMARLDLFGMDTLQDANKFQGMGLGGLWIDEPAPAADLTSGVPVDVLAMGVSSLSQAGVAPRAQITTNPPDEDHWVLSISEYTDPRLSIETFWIPPGENVHIEQAFRDRMRATFEAAGRPDLIRRLVEGRVGTVQVGLAVTPEFDERAHVSPEPLPKSPRWEAFRFADFGLNPTAIVCQRPAAAGPLLVLGALVGENMGVEQFIQEMLWPWMDRFAMRPRLPGGQSKLDAWGRPGSAGYTFRDIGDPAGKTREASNSDVTAVRTWERMLNTSFEPGPVEWPARRDAVKAALRHPLVRGKSFLLLDPEETKPLVRALGGRWHYHRDSSGRVYDKPVKDLASHPGDALGYGLAVLYPAEETARVIVPRPRVIRPGPGPKHWIGA